LYHAKVFQNLSIETVYETIQALPKLQYSCHIMEFEQSSFVYDYQMKHEKPKGFLLPK